MDVRGLGATVKRQGAAATQQAVGRLPQMQTSRSAHRSWHSMSCPALLLLVVACCPAAPQTPRIQFEANSLLHGDGEEAAAVMPADVEHR